MIIFFSQLSFKSLCPHPDKPGPIRGLPDTFFIVELEFDAAPTCRKNLACTSVKSSGVISISKELFETVDCILQMGFRIGSEPPEGAAFLSSLRRKCSASSFTYL